MAQKLNQQESPARENVMPKSNRRSYWAPKFWHGLTLPVWIRLLVRNRFAVSPSLWPIALSITLTATVHSMLAFLQSLFFSRRIARTEIVQPPIFILGHMRSGTTLLQRLFALDERFAFPTAYECFAPRSCLVSGWFVRRWLRFLQPARRPMDDMPAGLDLPHEDEFALCSLGLGSPYLQIAFPNRPQGEQYLDFATAAVGETQSWKDGLLRFVKQLTLRAGGKPIVLKSPTHTARVRLLLQLFPDARFVHIVRDPLEVIPSALWCWKSVFQVHGLQRPKYKGLEERVFRDFERIQRTFSEQKHLIPAENLCEVRYEDLVCDPVGEMRAIYEHLNLVEFETVRPKLEQHWDIHQDHRTNRYDLSQELAAEIQRRCADFGYRYGYGPTVPADSSEAEEREAACATAVLAAIG